MHQRQLLATGDHHDRLLQTFYSQTVFQKRRNSQPRSPTRQITFRSASAVLAMLPNRVLLPTPLPAKMPKRCPRPHSNMPSIAFWPVMNGPRSVRVPKETAVCYAPTASPVAGWGLVHPSDVPSRPRCVPLIPHRSARFGVLAIARPAFPHVVLPRIQKSRDVPTPA